MQAQGNERFLSSSPVSSSVLNGGADSRDLSSGVSPLVDQHPSQFSGSRAECRADPSDSTVWSSLRLERGSDEGWGHKIL